MNIHLEVQLSITTHKTNYENFKLKGKDKDWLDNFGNLCLISRSKNSRLSNFMPAAKKEYYTGSPTIDSIKQRIMMEYEQWDTNGSNNINEIKNTVEND